MEYRHTPVMLNQVLEYLDLKPGDNAIDCTMGGMGYSLEILKKISPEGHLLSIDLDEMAIKNAKKITQKQKITNIKIVHDNFKNLRKIVETKWPKVLAQRFSGIVFDLGLSSAQLEDISRGFSFKVDSPLKMNFGVAQEGNDDFGISNTEDIVNRYSERELLNIIRNYGEEKYASSIVRNIIEKRKEQRITTTGQLLDVIAKSVPGSYLHNKKIHFATRTFQAFRIATNHEMDNLRNALSAAVDFLAPNGKVVVISYHSLEDRIVKQFFREEEKQCICPKEAPICQCDHSPRLSTVTKKVLIPDAEEIKQNPRCRSAKMRVARKNA